MNLVEGKVSASVLISSMWFSRPAGEKGHTAADEEGRSTGERRHGNDAAEERKDFRGALTFEGHVGDRDAELAGFLVHRTADGVGHLLSLRPQVRVEPDPRVAFAHQSLQFQGARAGPFRWIGQQDSNKFLWIPLQHVGDVLVVKHVVPRLNDHGLAHAGRLHLLQQKLRVTWHRRLVRLRIRSYQSPVVRESLSLLLGRPNVQVRINSSPQCSSGTSHASPSRQPKQS
mmetsp:Transcript_14222/g.40351  ORF Transcript_14222/g.40351 Transcript_14222/m.40351 type:complete len:229 (+) Transcript_14222:409-1095(+)